MSLPENLRVGASRAVTVPAVSRLSALLRGFMRRCPNCGEGRLFRSYVVPKASCGTCGEPLGVYRADDAPAYFTILLVGHVIVPAMLALEVSHHPSVLVHLLLWVPLTLLMTLALLPHIKGALIGLLWSLGTRG